MVLIIIKILMRQYIYIYIYTHKVLEGQIQFIRVLFFQFSQKIFIVKCNVFLLGNN